MSTNLICAGKLPEAVLTRKQSEVQKQTQQINSGGSGGIFGKSLLAIVLNDLAQWLWEWKEHCFYIREMLSYILPVSLIKFKSTFPNFKTNPICIVKYFLFKNGTLNVHVRDVFISFKKSI